MSRRHDLDWVRILAFGRWCSTTGMYYVSWDSINSPHAGRAGAVDDAQLAPGLSLLFLVSGVATVPPARARREAETGGVRPSVRARGGCWCRWPRHAGGRHHGRTTKCGGEAARRLPRRLPLLLGPFTAADQGFCGDDCLIVPTWNHLWFVAYLWAYTVAAWLLLRLAPRAMERAGTRLGTLLAAGPTVLLAPALLLALVRVLLVGRFQSTHALVDDWYNHAQYFTVFLLGFLVARSDRVWDAIERVRWPALWLWLASLAAIAG